MPGATEDRPEIPAAWEAAARTIRDERPARLVVLGETDTGKSTFCRFLLARLREAGLKAAVLDTDPGQNALGPPATLALGDAEAGAAALYFVGGTNPAAHVPAMIAGTARLAARAGADCLLVNTTGLVRGPGLPLKQHKIEVLAPDLVVALQRGDELAPLLAAHAHIPRLDLRPSPAARRRSPAERRRAREAGYAAAFQDARPVEVAPGTLVIQRLGRSGPPPVGPAAPLLCALADGGGTVKGLALLERFEEGRPLALRTAVPMDGMRILQLGALCLAEGWRERPLAGFGPRPHTGT